ncbi:acyl-CoA N-acyltransferase [Ramicandelaber brevisporus]|nr:acyl-CoA N-acyltransferase [Ramicandelaber brevisporus]
MEIAIQAYTSEEQLGEICRLIDRELSEPYTVYSYRYFLSQWGQHCYLAYAPKQQQTEQSNKPRKQQQQQKQQQNESQLNDNAVADNDNDNDDNSLELVGCIICRIDDHKCGHGFGVAVMQQQTTLKRGYIAMLAVEKHMRGHGIGKKLVKRAIDSMIADGADEIVLETETKNVAALALYEGLGFVRDKRLHSYYIGGTDAYRLKLWPSSSSRKITDMDQYYP